MKWFKKNESTEVIDAVATEVVDGEQPAPETEEKKISVKKVVGIAVGALAVAGGIAAAKFIKKPNTEDGYTDVTGPYDPEAEAVDAVPVADEEDFSETAE